jgi:hypothetical protein
MVPATESWLVLWEIGFGERRVGARPVAGQLFGNSKEREIFNERIYRYGSSCGGWFVAVGCVGVGGDHHDGEHFDSEFGIVGRSERDFFSGA